MPRAHTDARLCRSTLRKRAVPMPAHEIPKDLVKTGATRTLSIKANLSWPSAKVCIAPRNTGAAPAELEGKLGK